MPELPESRLLADELPTEILDGTWIIVPAFNEGPIVGGVIRELTERFRNVVVVDDGSADDTLAAALAAGAIGVRHVVNLGQGASLRTGFDLALRRGADFLATFDADGQHRPGDIGVALARLVGSGADVALGSRFLGIDSDMPRSRSLLLKAAVLFTRAVSGLHVTDAHNGLRVLTRDAARRLTIEQPRMAHASEILHGIARHRLRWIEVPVRVSYTARSRRKGQSALDSINILFDLFVRRFLH